MTWGIVVDRAGGDNGFGLGSELSSTFQYGNAANPTLQLANGLIGGTDDYLILSANTTSAFAGANGVASQIIFNLAAAGLAGGEKFAIIWFETGAAGGTISQGAKYGIITNDAFVVPASEGATVDVVAGRGQSPLGGTTFTYAIPEPSAVLLGLLGAVGLIRRRR